MSNTRNLADLLDTSGDIKSAALDNVTPTTSASDLTSGTLAAARIANDTIDSAHVAAGAVDDAHISGLAATKLTGTVAAARLDTATTQAESDDSTKIATTAYVVDKITTLIGGAPSTLNDLNELAAAINDDASYNSTLTTALATKMPLAGGAFTGAVTTNSTIDGRDVAADGVTADAALPKAGGTMTGHLILTNNSTALQSLDAGGTANRILTMDNADTLILGNPTTVDDIRFDVDTYGEGAMLIKSDGKVGIGISAPTADLHIHNSADHTRLNIDCSNSSGDNWQFQSRNNGEFWLRNDDNSRNDIVVYPSSGDADFIGNITAKSYDASAMGVTKWYQSSNSGNPEFYIGSSDTNRLGIQTVYDSGSQNLAYTHFFTHTANNSADAGRMIFSVDDGAEKLRINDAGVAVTGVCAATSFSGAGVIDTVTNTDPAITTNPSAVGHIWFNKTTGNIFTCTRNTTDENVWVNARSSKSIRYQKTNGTSDLFGDGSDKLHLQFNEILASAETVKDYSGNFTCTAHQNVDFTTDSMFSSYAAQFNGNGEITIPFMSNTFRRTDDFTISIWITRKGNIPDGTLPFSFNGNSSTNGRGVRVAGNNIYRVSTTAANTMLGQFTNGATFTVNDGDHFVLIGYGDSTNKLYKNGSLVGTTGAATLGHSNVSNSAGGCLGGTGHVYNPTGYDSHQYYQCTVNNFRVFSKAVSSTEVATLYAEGY